MEKLLFVFGTRPEAIKMAPVILEFKKYPDIFDTVVCVTGQHREMLDVVLDLYNIKPDIDLNIMKKNQDLFSLSSKILMEMKGVLEEYTPDYVLVQGDTTTAFLAGLSAFYKGIKVAHIEAGLRTYDISAPFPEEANRRMLSSLCNICFPPTEESKKNLEAERIPVEKIKVTGNTVIDALLIALDKVRSEKGMEDKECFKSLDFQKKIILVTGHRRENFGDGFKTICRSLKTLADRYPMIDIVYPVHLNPNVQGPVFEYLGETDNIKLIEPLDYFNFLYLLDRSYIVLTDSGGIQEEAPSLGKPVLVMRETTERPEGITAGTVKLVGTDFERITEETVRLLEDETVYNSMSQAHNPYGDGKAASRIVDYFTNKSSVN